MSLQNTDEFKRAVCKKLSHAAYRSNIEELVAEASEVGAIVRQTWPAIGGGRGFAAFTATLSLGNTGEAVVVAFRGTKGATEWMTYPHAFAREVVRTVEGLTAFTPFVDALEEMWEEPGDWVNGYIADCSLEDSIGHALRGGRQLWLTGHSRGGAIAQISSALLVCGEESRQSTHLLRRLSVVTFNAPMALVANDVLRYEEARRLYGVEHRRIEHRGDMIRLLPAGLGLKHGGDQEVHGETLAESGNFARTVGSALSAFAVGHGVQRTGSGLGSGGGEQQMNGGTVSTQGQHVGDGSNSQRLSLGSIAIALVRHAAFAHQK